MTETHTTPPLALTFDDVLIEPGYSTVHPNEVDLRTRLCRDIHLNIPILSAAMDTVTESRLAIALAQEGGLGVIHKNLSIDLQAAEVDKVKRSEAGMIVDPVTMRPEQRISEALELMAHFKISGRAGDRCRGPSGRHPDQPRPALRKRPEPPDLGPDDARGPGHGTRRDDPGRGQGAAAHSTRSRSSWWWTAPAA